MKNSVPLWVIIYFFQCLNIFRKNVLCVLPNKNVLNVVQKLKVNEFSVPPPSPGASIVYNVQYPCLFNPCSKTYNHLLIYKILIYNIIQGTCHGTYFLLNHKRFKFYICSQRWAGGGGKALTGREEGGMAL